MKSRKTITLEMDVLNSNLLSKIKGGKTITIIINGKEYTIEV
jgi:hypothetical protein